MRESLSDIAAEITFAHGDIRRVGIGRFRRISTREVYGDLALDDPVTITNCCNNYGPHQFSKKVIPLFTSKALRNEPLPLYASTQNCRE